MITKGIIKSIDFNGNTCMVRIPLFENATSNNEIVIEAIVSTTPGMYNGYKENDVVIVGFENNKIDAPIVLGKLYLGVATEKADPRGAINCTTINASTAASIPMDTKLTLENDAADNTEVNVANGLSSYATTAALAKGLQRQETEIGSINVKMIDDGESLGARVTKVEQDNAIQEAEIVVNASNIAARVKKQDSNGDEKGLSWDLNTKSWSINAHDTVRYPEESATGELKDFNIVTIDRKGMSIAGDLKLNGYPTEVVTQYLQWDYKEESEEHHLPSTGWSDTMPAHEDGKYIWQKITTTKYIWHDDNGGWWETEATPEITCLSGVDAYDAAADAAQAAADADDHAGEAYALAEGKTTNYYSPTDPSSTYSIKKGDCWFDTTAGEDDETLKQWDGSAWQDIGGELVTNKVTANYVNALKITAEKIEVPNLFIADNLSSPKKVEIAGFTVDANSIYSGNLASWDSGDVLVSRGTTSTLPVTGAPEGTKNWAFVSGKDFGVTNSGKLYASSAKINGAIEATSLTIASGGTCDITAGDIGAVASDDLTDRTSTDYGRIVNIANGAIEAYSITANKIEVKTSGANPKTVLYANAEENKVEIGGFKATDGDFHTIDKTIGNEDSLFLSSTGISDSSGIGGSSGDQNWLIAASNKFGVNTDGNIFAKNATISGEITATSGFLGNASTGLTIGTDGIYSYSGDNLNYSVTASGISYTGAATLRFHNIGLTAETSGNTTIAYISDISKQTGFKFTSTDTPSSFTNYRIEVKLKPQMWSSARPFHYYKGVNPTLIFTLQNESGSAITSNITIATDLVFYWGDVKFETSATLNFLSSSSISVYMGYGDGNRGSDSENMSCAISFPQITSYYYKQSDGVYRNIATTWSASGSFPWNVMDFNKITGNSGEAMNRVNALREAEDALADNSEYSMGYIWIRDIKNATSLTSLSDIAPNTDIGMYLGYSDKRWLAVYAQSYETASDINVKYDVLPIDNNYEAIFDNLKPTTYKLLKGTSKRTHLGFIAQDVKQAVEMSGLTTHEFAAYCDYKNPSLNDDQAKCGLRYDEFIALNTDQIQKLKARTKQLEEKVLELEAKLEAK